MLLVDKGQERKTVRRRVQAMPLLVYDKGCRLYCPRTILKEVLMQDVVQVSCWWRACRHAGPFGVGACGNDWRIDVHCPMGPPTPSPTETGAVVPVQLSADGKTLQWIVPGNIPAGTARHFTLRRSEAGDPTNSYMAWPGVAVVQKTDRLLFDIEGIQRAQYTFLGARRPYFWPLLGPSGISVVRGQGTEEHPHHTGLTLAYGGHGEGGSTNIWSDWDELPYGPCGRMVHRGFRYIRGGPVYAEMVEDLTYLRVDGEHLLDEVRHLRLWSGPVGSLFLDFAFEIGPIDDAGTHPFLLAARLPGSMDIPATGKVAGSEGPRPGSDDFAGRWVDASGPLGDGWNGIAILDHPGNDGYPGALCKFAVAAQITQCHYPPQAELHGRGFTIRQRVYVHDGDAQTGHVEEHWAAYATDLAVMREG